MYSLKIIELRIKLELNKNVFWKQNDESWMVISILGAGASTHEQNIK